MTQSAGAKFSRCTKPALAMIVFQVNLSYFVKFTNNVHVDRRHFVFPHLQFFFVTHASLSN